MFEFTGDDQQLYPSFIYSNCRDMMNTRCEIDGNGYLGQLKNWIDDLTTKGTLDFKNFDDVQLWSKMNFQDAGGWGYIGGVCRGSLGSANIAAIYGDAWSIKSSAHELGMHIYSIRTHCVHALICMCRRSLKIYRS